MKLMRAHIIIVCICLFWGSVATAQQSPQYSQFVFNNYLINPAAGGTNDYIDFKLGYRTQWLGFDAQPVTYLFSIHSPVKFGGKAPGPFGERNHHALGGYVLKDETGPIGNISAYGSYSYHMRLSYTTHMSFGFFGGIKQYNLDAGGLTTPNNTESLPSISTITPDAAAGLWLYSRKYFGGFSAHQLIPLGMGGTQNKLVMHYYLTGGYVIKLKKINSKLIPSAHVKFGLITPVQADLMLKFDYQEILWAGISYRKLDAIIGIVGINIRNFFQVGYAFDFTTSKIRQYSSNTHEVIVTYRFKPRKRMQDMKCPDWG